MKKIITFILTLAVLTGCGAIIAEAAMAEKMFVTGNKVRERTEPNTDCEIVATHNKGKDVEVVAAENGWAQLENGNYMSMDYLVTEDKSAELFNNLPMLVLGDHVRERSSMDTSDPGNIEAVHDAGETVYVAERLDGWYRLTNGNYISADFLTADTQDIAAHFLENYKDIIIVYISEQKVEYYQYDVVIAEGPCVTGTEGKRDTPIGLYDVKSKNNDFDMNGNPDTHVERATYFNGGIAFHDAHWRSRFGGSIYKTSGSHGCVNCPDDLAYAIYDNSRKGYTYVLVLP